MKASLLNMKNSVTMKNLTVGASCPPTHFSSIAGMQQGTEDTWASLPPYVSDLYLELSVLNILCWA